MTTDRDSVPEEHFTLYGNLGTSRNDLCRDTSGRRVSSAANIDIPDKLAQRSNRDRERMHSAIAIFQFNGNVGGSGIEIRNSEILLESSASVALGKEPVIRRGLHTHDICCAGDSTGIARAEVTKVGGTLDCHWLRRGERDGHVSWQARINVHGENRPPRAGRDRQRLSGNRLPTCIVGGGDICRSSTRRIQNRQERIVGPATRLSTLCQVSKVEGSTQAGRAQCITSTIDAECIEVHGTLSHDTRTTAGSNDG